MLSKNNRQMLDHKMERRSFRFSLRKLNTGLASVVLGFTFGYGLISDQPLVHADEAASSLSSASSNQHSATISGADAETKSAMLASESTSAGTETALSSAGIASTADISASTVLDSAAGVPLSSDVPTSSAVGEESASVQEPAAAVSQTAAEPAFDSANVAIQENSLTLSGTEIGNTGNSQRDITATISYTGNAGDKVIFKLPANQDGQNQIAYYIVGASSLSIADTTITNDTINGFYYVTTVLKQSGSISQKISIASRRNDSFDGQLIDGESIGQREFTATLSAVDGNGNDLGSTAKTFTQIISPDMDPALSREPSSEASETLLPNVDYTHKLDLKETKGIYDNEKYPTARVNSSVNYGTTITIPVPASFKLNADATAAKNAFTDGTTITQAQTGADIIITVPKGAGSTLAQADVPYYLVGQYVVSGNVDETVTADGNITIVQNLNDQQDHQLIKTLDQPWTENLNSIAQPGKPGGSAAGAWDDKTISISDATASKPSATKISTFGIQNITIYDLNDATLTFTVADGFKATGITTAKLNGVTKYAYVLYYADGTTSQGTVAAGETISAVGTSSIRKAVLTPDLIKAGAATDVALYAMNGTIGNYFYINGRLTEKYDDGTAVQVGDQLTNTLTIGGSNLISSVLSVTQTITGGLSSNFKGNGGGGSGYAGTIGVGSITNGYAGEWPTYVLDHPIFYIKLPQYTSFNPDLSIFEGNPVVATFYVNNGQEQVVKLDYSQSDYVFDNSKLFTNDTNGVFKVAFDINNDALPGLYQGLVYVKTSTPLPKNQKAINDKKLYKPEYTGGVVTDDTYVANAFSTQVLSPGAEFTIGGVSQGNADGTDYHNHGSSLNSGDDSMSYKLTPKNLTGSDLTNSRIYVNLPDNADVVLTGPVTVNTAGSVMVLYSTTAVDLNDNAEPDTSSWLTADEVKDWSQIKSFVIQQPTLSSSTAANLSSIVVNVKDRTLADDAGKQLALGFKSYADQFATPIKQPNATYVQVYGQSTETKTVTRTINVHQPDGTTAVITQTATIARINTVQKDGTTTTGTWSTSGWESFNAPEFAGYTPDIASVAEAVVDENSTDQTIDITYQANEQQVLIKYIDLDENDRVIDEISLTGPTNTQSDYSTAARLQELIAQGYELVADSVPAKIIFDSIDDIDGNVSQVYTVKLRHQTHAATTSSSVTRTINYVDEKGNPVNGSPDGSSTYVQTATFNRTAIIDSVTGEVLGYDVDGDGKVDTTDADTAWMPSSAELGAVKSADPVTLGFDYVDLATVESATVTPGQQELTQSVVYSKAKVSGTIKYVDDVTGKTLDEFELPIGEVGSLIGYTTADQIKQYEERGYELTSSDFVDGTQIYAKTGNDFVVHFKHAIQVVTPNDPNPVTPGDPINPNYPDGPYYPADVSRANLVKDATQTIHYVGAGDQTPSDKVQTQKDAFTRTITIDKVTGEVLATSAWTGSFTFGTEDTDVIEGYHADKKTAGGLTTTAAEPDVTATVTYAPNGKLIPIDAAGNPIPGADTPTYPTDPTDPTKVMADEPIPVIQGYTPVDPSPVTPIDAGKDTFVPYTQNEYQLTERFVDEEGNELAPSKNGVYHYGDSFDVTKDAQVISGYVLVKQENTAGTFGDSDQTAKFIYKQVGRIIPVDEAGNPIPGADTPSYQNDPSDPTKVVPNESVPVVPGYTPSTPTVTPTDPTQDTTVTYIKNQTPIAPEEPTTPETPEQPQAPTDPAESPVTSNISGEFEHSTDSAAVENNAKAVLSHDKANDAKQLPQTGNAQHGSILAMMGLVLAGLGFGVVKPKKRKS
ncbi:mucin-binding protein [Limosilactobacillus allomucosae]|uniref:mucin-binding protein n=1 Tax=Limosilactobacillus allomucosae TaxID=3142938 RepID=UPI003264E0F6